ncbi:MAG: glycosyltransferase family 4 protein [Bdellovibrionales bacterium]
MVVLLFLCLSFLLSLGLTIWLRRWLLKLAFLDCPNVRSSHRLPVPRGGGWAILGAILPGILWNHFTLPNGHAYSWLLAGLSLSALISWQDDRKGVPAGIRLIVHLVAAAMGTFFWLPDQMLLGGVLPLLIDRTLVIIGWAMYMNIYNFMDGIDGITGIETISLAVGVGLCLTAAGLFAPGLDVMTAVLVGASLGFLSLNWHPGKIFLGDIGSVPLGYLTGFCLLTLALHGEWAAAIILPMYYLTDSCLTIMRRALRGEKVWKAHCEHFYQKAAARWIRHDKVALIIMVSNIGLILLAVAAASVSLLSIKLGLIAAAAGLTALTLRRLQAED